MARCAKWWWSTQGWLGTALEESGQKQADWRTDPARAGAGALGDIGSHAEQLARYVIGQRITRMLADVGTVIPGRRVDDDANLLLRYEGGVRGILHCSQVASGEENRISLRVYGSEGSLEWSQEDPNRLFFRPVDGPMQTLTRGSGYLSTEAQRATRLPSGHPEAFFEAFANVYANALRTIAARVAGETPDAADLDFPTVHDGATGVHFIETALRSGGTVGSGGHWVDATYTPPRNRRRRSASLPAFCTRHRFYYASRYSLHRPVGRSSARRTCTQGARVGLRRPRTGVLGRSLRCRTCRQ